MFKSNMLNLVPDVGGTSCWTVPAPELSLSYGFAYTLWVGQALDYYKITSHERTDLLSPSLSSESQILQFFQCGSDSGQCPETEKKLNLAAGKWPEPHFLGPLLPRTGVKKGPDGGGGWGNMRVGRTGEPVPHRSLQQIGDRDIEVNFKMLMGLATIYHSFM